MHLSNYRTDWNTRAQWGILARAGCYPVGYFFCGNASRAWSIGSKRITGDGW